MDGLQVSLGIDTKTALKDARVLGNDIKRILDGIDPTNMSSRLKTLVKQLTAAQYGMERVANAANKIANTKVPTADYAYMTKEMDKAEKSLSRMLEKKAELERSGNTMGNAYRSLTEEIVNVRANISSLRTEMRDMETANEAFVSGTTTEAFKKNLQALNLQNQSAVIAITRFKEYADANGIVINTKKEDTEATNKQTEATKNLQRAEDDLENSRQRHAGISRGVAIRNARLTRGGYLIDDDVNLGVANPHRKAISRGPALSGARLDRASHFFSEGMSVGVRQLSQDEEHLDNSVRKTNEDIQKQNNEVQRSSKNFNSANRAARSFASTLLNSLGSAIRRVVSGLGSISRHLHSSHHSSLGLGKSMKHTFSTFLRYTLGIRSMFMLVRRVRGYIKEAFKVMAQEIPEVNKDISMLGHSFKELKAGFGTILQPLLKMLAPILDGLLQRVISLMNAIGKFFATLAGQDYVYQATVANYDYAESVKEAENSLASFDKLNVISKSKNDLALTKDTVKYEKVKIEPDENWYTKLAQAIKEGWEKGDLSGATNALAEKLATWLDGIKWKDIKAKSKKFSKTLATGINGLTLPDPKTGKSHLAESIGKTIGNAIDWAIENIDEFVTDLDWGQLGAFIETTITSLKDKLEENESWKKAGDAFGKLFQGVVDLGFKLFIEGNIFEGLGENISVMINTAVEKGMQIKPGTNMTYFEAFGEMLSEGLIKMLEQIEIFIDKSGDDIAKAINHIFLGVETTKLFTTLGRVLLKGLFLGIKMVVAAGLGALGIKADEKTIEFIAEALGLGLLALKIKNLVKAITGSSSLFGGGGTGGLLGAFKKKDKALDRQTGKVGAESSAVGGLIDKIGGLVSTLLVFLIPSLSSTTDEITDLTTETEVYTKTAEDSNERIKNSYADTVAKLKEDITTMETDLANAKLKTPNVDTTSLENMITDAKSKVTALETVINNANLNTPAIGTSAIDSWVEYFKGKISDIKTELGKLDKDIDSHRGGEENPPKTNIDDEEIRRLKEANDKTNGLVDNSYKANGTGGDKGQYGMDDYAKWWEENVNGKKTYETTPLYELTQEAIKSEQERQKQEEQKAKERANTVSFAPLSDAPMLSGSMNDIGAMYDMFFGSATGLSKQKFTELLQNKMNNLSEDDLAYLILLQMAATSGVDMGVDKSGMLNYWQTLLQYTKSDINSKYQGRDKMETFLNELFGIETDMSSGQKGQKLLATMLPLLAATGTVSGNMSAGAMAEMEQAQIQQRLAEMMEMIKKMGGSKFNISGYATGAVLPPNKPFLGILGDQKSGTNVEAPLSTIEQAVANVLSRIQIKNVFDVQGDPNRLFKVVQKQARIEYNQTGQHAFP